MIFTILLMCAENVLKDSLILCSSPISAKILSKTYMFEFSLAGIFNPLHAIAVKSPTVFNVTVLPPAFGPVITRFEKSFPNLIDIGTTSS